MKKDLLVVLLCIHVAGISQTREVIVNKETKIPYNNSAHDGPALITFQIPVVIEYNGITPGHAFIPLFTIRNISNASLAPSLTAFTPASISTADYDLAPKQMTFTVNVQLAATVALDHDESFDIQLSGAVSPNDPKHHIVIQKKQNNNAASGNVVSITHIPVGIDTFPLIREKPAKDLRLYNLKYRVNGELKGDTTVMIEVDASGTSIKIDKITESFTIKKGTAAGDYNVRVSFYINSVQDFSDDEHVRIFFKNNTNVFDVITFTRRHMINPNKPFWIEVGANFDFIDGLKPNNFFSGVFLHKRDISSVHFRKQKAAYPSSATHADSIEVEKEDLEKKRNWKNLSLFGGVYESKSISLLSETKERRVYYDASTAPTFPGDSVGIYTDTGITKNIQVVRNVSLFFSPQLRLTNHSANEDGLHVFFSIWSEVQWQKISLESDFAHLKRQDTALRVPRSQANFHLSLAGKTTLDLKSHYLGLGFPIFFKDGDVNLFANPVFGWSTQMKHNELKPFLSPTSKVELDINDEKRVWRPFYVFQFRLNEERYGIAFTGEVRGLVMKQSPPIISLALSKKFDLKKFIEFNK